MQASNDVALSWSALSARQARRILLAELHGTSILASKQADAALIVSELVGNALRHARPMADGQLRLQWELDGDRLWLAVVDGGGDSVPTVRQQHDYAVGGRGLAMVDALTVSWGSGNRDGANTVWAVLDIGSDLH